MLTASGVCPAAADTGADQGAPAYYDSGLARLWAADPDRIAQHDEADLGMRYGILTKGTYFAAGVGDGKSTSGSVAILPRSIRFSAGPGFRLQGGRLWLDASARIAAGAWIEILDLRGRSLGRLDLEAFRSGNGFAIPLDRLARFGAGRLVVVLRGAARGQSFAIAMGGRP